MNTLTPRALLCSILSGMNPEYNICGNCKIKNTCHPKLIPIIVGRDGRSIPGGKLHKEAAFSTICGRYTCSTDGEYVARQLMTDPEHKREFEVTELDASIHTILASVFGTSGKRTDMNELRIVEESGRVYAKQDEMYYFTQDLNS